MNIAIILTGHLRTWEYCKQNFEENLLDSNENIDIFVNTYKNKFSPFVQRETETSFANSIPQLTEEEIRGFFSGLNVVEFNIEEDFKLEDYNLNSMISMETSYFKFLKYCFRNSKKYDLIISYRYDNFIYSKLNYRFIYDTLRENGNRLINCTTPFLNIGINQNNLMIIANPEVSNLVFLRHRLFNPEKYNVPNIIHDTLSELNYSFNIEILYNLFEISVVRYDDVQNKFYFERYAYPRHYLT